MEQQTGECYRFGPFRLDARERLLYRGEELVGLTPKAADTLLMLVRNPGRLLTKDELMQAVWPDSFVEENSLTQNIWMLRKVLGQTAEQAFIETVPKRGYRFVSEVQSAAAPQPDQDEPLHPAPPTKMQPATAEPSRKLFRIGSAIFVGAILVLAYFVLRVRPTSMAARRSVAIIQFKNLSNEPDAAWLSTALAEMFSTELAAGSGLRVVSNENVAQLQIDAGTKDELGRIQESLKCDLLLIGTYLRVGQQIRVDVRLEDARSGEIMESLSQTDSEANLLALVSGLGSGLRGRLGIAPPSSVQAENIRATVPQNPEASRLYAEGLARLREFDASGAESLLTRAVAADPRFPLSRSAHSDALRLLGYDEKAKSEAKLAFELATRLSREDRLVVEARYRKATSEWSKAIDNYRTLWNSYPDNGEYGIELASALTYAGQGKQALQVIESLRKLPSTSGDARVDIAEAAAAGALADYRRGLVAARRAVQSARSGGARLLEAGALIEEGKCLSSLTRPADSKAAFEKAGEICGAVGDKHCVGETLNREASLVRAQGDFNRAEGLLREALAISEQSGDRRARARSLTVLANILRARADMAGAQKLFEESLAVSEESGDKRAATLAHINLGNVMNNSGHPEPAKDHYRQALALAHETGDRNQIAIAMGNLAIVAYSEGDLAGARKTLEEVLAMKRQIGDQGSYAYSLVHLGNVLLFQGDIAGARKAWKEQCRINEAAGEKIALASCRLGLADLDLREGHPEAAEPVARKVASEFTTVNPAAEAWKLLAEASLRRGDLKTAQEAARKATQLAQKSPNGADYGIPIAITAARVDAALGRTGEAVVSLNDSLERAKGLHLVGLQFSARLSLCEINRNPQEIAQLEQDARSMGFGLVARNAAGLRSNHK